MSLECDPTDVVLILLMGKWYVCLTLTPKEATTATWAIMKCPLIDADNTY